MSSIKASSEEQLVLMKPYLATADWKKRRLLILQRDGYTCAYCQRDANSVDHVVPRSHGGTDDLDNLVACCSSCNSSKGDRFFSSILLPPLAFPDSLSKTYNSPFSTDTD